MFGILLQTRELKHKFNLASRASSMLRPPTIRSVRAKSTLGQVAKEHYEVLIQHALDAERRTRRAASA